MTKLYFPVTLSYYVYPIHFVSTEDRFWRARFHFPNNKSSFFLFTFYRSSLCKLAAIRWECLIYSPIASCCVALPYESQSYWLVPFFWVDLIWLCALFIQSNAEMCNFTTSENKSQLVRRSSSTRTISPCLKFTRLQVILKSYFHMNINN